MSSYEKISILDSLNFVHYFPRCEGENTRQAYYKVQYYSPIEELKIQYCYILIVEERLVDLNIRSQVSEVLIEPTVLSALHFLSQAMEHCKNTSNQPAPFSESAVTVYKEYAELYNGLKSASMRIIHLFLIWNPAKIEELSRQHPFLAECYTEYVRYTPRWAYTNLREFEHWSDDVWSYNGGLREKIIFRTSKEVLEREYNLLCCFLFERLHYYYFSVENDGDGLPYPEREKYKLQLENARDAVFMKYFNKSSMHMMFDTKMAELEENRTSLDKAELELKICEVLDLPWRTKKVEEYEMGIAFKDILVALIDRMCKCAVPYDRTRSDPANQRKMTCVVKVNEKFISTNFPSYTSELSEVLDTMRIFSPYNYKNMRDLCRDLKTKIGKALVHQTEPIRQARCAVCGLTKLRISNPF